MAYVSLYRKYRPQTFEDVVGQEHVTTTLRNAVSEGRIASGYLFTGTRGTAKTTCARILAKALNCLGSDGQRTTPNPQPCGICRSCQEIASSTSLGVFEIDAASHGGVDDVRDLVREVGLNAMGNRYKVYIIDEAHQLGPGAKDAFLKTLEEPPDRVVFILATTELERMPITIQSRCQVFEFKRGSVPQIASRLSEVLQAEGVQAEPAAVTLVARAADGSYRDSLSLLEQVLAYKRTGITVRDTTAVLGTIDEDVLSRVVALIAASDAAGAFAVAADILESGKDVRQFLKSLSGRLRDLLFVGVGAQPTSAGELDDSPELRRQAASFSPAALLQALQVLTEAEQETKRSNQHRLLLEMALLRLMHLPQSASAPAPYVAPAPTPQPATPKPIPAATAIPQVKQPPSALSLPVSGGSHATLTPPESAPRSGAGNRAGGPPSPPPTAPPVPAAPAEGDTPTALFDIAPPLDEDDPDDSALSDSDLVDDDEPPDLDALLPGDDDLDTLPLADEELLPPPIIGGPGGPLLESEETSAPSLLVTTPDEHDVADDFMQVQQVAEAPAVVPANGNGHRPDLGPDAAPELIYLQKNWQEVVNRMGSRQPSGVGLVKDAHPVALMGHTITLQFSNQFNVDRMERPRAREIVEEIINKTLKAEPATFKIKAAMPGQALPAKIALGTAPKARETVAPAPQAHSPFLDEVIAVFGGQVLDDDTKG